MSESQTDDLRSVIRTHVERVLADCDGQADRAYLRLGIGRTTIYRWLREWRREDRAIRANHASVSVREDA